MSANPRMEQRFANTWPDGRRRLHLAGNKSLPAISSDNSSPLWSIASHTPRLCALHPNSAA